MNELQQLCKSFKKDFTPKIQDAKRPVRYWSEKDVFNGKTTDAYVIILRTKGCSWALKSGCTMCGYFNDSLWKNVSDTDIAEQFERATGNHTQEKIVKIFTSGSFFDDKEVSPKIRKTIFKKLAETAEKISVESRPEFITEKKLSEVKNIFLDKTFEVGIGLETANDVVREYAINKGFTFKQYKKVAELIKKQDFKLKTYVLIKPPFLTEKESINDSIETADKIKSYTNSISFNPTNVQRNTLVEYLWKRRQYRPAWLWSVVEILKESKKKVKNVRLQCDIAGGGSPRGAHNCRNCDKQVLKAIESFSLSQDIKVLDNLDCDCKDKWHDQLDLESMGFGSLTDLSRGYQ